MSANPIIYCLENLTDYRQFERLCSDIMAGTGYDSIEPIGGTGDRGRDALHYSKIDSITTVFAYSVRSDWRKKLIQDCERIKEENHAVDSIVFVCTKTINGNQRDQCVSMIYENYGWSLEIFDLERIRVLLTGKLRFLLAQHPSIFCPPWFPSKGGLSVAESKDTLIIDYASHDHALAIWLARKLSVTGYKTWCYGMAPLAGENINESITTLIDKRAIHYLPILSIEAFTDSDFIGRIGYASVRKELTLPCWSDDLSNSRNTATVLQVEPARFYESYRKGLESVIDGLKAKGITPDYSQFQGNEIALKAYMPEPVTKVESEKIYTNIFQVSLPKSVVITGLNSALDNEELDNLRETWAFVKVSKLKFISFEDPPQELSTRIEKSLELSWRDYPNIEGKKSGNVIRELIRRSLNVACYLAGMRLCDDRKALYFPEKENGKHNISFIHLDGRKTHVTMTGLKTDGWGDRATQFRYQLGPQFKVSCDENGGYWVTTRIYVRVTDLEGVPFKGKVIGKKRKKVTKSWWNKQWVGRTIGMMQGISNTENQEEILIGSGSSQVAVSTKPLQWDCPISIDAEAVERIGDFQEEMADIKTFEVEEDEIIEEETN